MSNKGRVNLESYVHIKENIIIRDLMCQYQLLVQKRHLSTLGFVVFFFLLNLTN